MTHDIAFHADRIRVDGFTIVEDLLPTACVERLRDAFDAQLDAYRTDTPTNRGANRYQMYLPWAEPFADPLLYENDVVLAIVETVFGYRAAGSDQAVTEQSLRSICTYFASDTPLPGADYQRVHSDTQLLFPEAGLALPAYGLVLNVPLVDVTDENGPMEIWAGGTHLWQGSGEMAALAPTMTSQRVLMRTGSALIRDLRMWHRGTPNLGARSRPNLALVYTRPWYRFEQQPPAIGRSAWERLSPRARRLLRCAVVIEP